MGSFPETKIDPFFCGGGGGGGGGGIAKRDFKTTSQEQRSRTRKHNGIWISFLKSTSRTDFSKLKSVSGFCV